MRFDKRAGLTIMSLFIISQCASARVSPSSMRFNQPSGFLYQGKPINPICVSMINSSQVDKPFLYDINVNHCQYSDAAYGWDGQKRSFKQSDGLRYSYKVVGVTSNHVYVLSTYTNTGGTGYFQDLLFLRLKEKYYFSYDEKEKRFVKRPYQSMSYVGELIGGDRYSGSFVNLSVKGNHLVGYRYSPNNPAFSEKYPRVAVNINLAGL